MKSLSKGKMWCYAIGQLGWSIISGLIGSWLVYFYQPDAIAKSEGMTPLIPEGRVIFGILTIIGLITAGGRIFDAITDPLVGNWSDKCKSKNGKRIPFMKWSAIPLGIIFVLVFCAPTKSISTLNTAWVFIFIAAYYFAITCYCTPYTSLLAELTHSQEEKLKLSTCISLTFIVGTAIGYVAPVIWGSFIGGGMSRIPAMRLTFLILSVIATICMMVPVFTIKEKDYSDAKPSESSMLSSLGKTFKNKDFRIFVVQDIIYFLGLTMFQTGLPFFVTSLLRLNETMSTVMFVGLTALSLVFYPFINILAKKYGKKRLVVFAFIGFVFTFGLTAISGPNLKLPIMIQAILIVVLGSFPMAIFGICPQAIVADIAQSDEIITGENRSGMFYAARTFAMKFGQSAAMLVFTSIATIGIYTASNQNLAKLSITPNDTIESIISERESAIIKIMYDSKSEELNMYKFKALEPDVKFILTTTDGKTENIFNTTFDQLSLKVEKYNDVNFSSFKKSGVLAGSLETNDKQLIADIVVETGIGYRIIALIASICCLLGGIFMILFNEKKINSIINK